MKDKDALPEPWWTNEIPGGSFDSRIASMTVGWAARSILKMAIYNKKTIRRFQCSGEFDGDIGKFFTVVKKFGGHIVVDEFSYEEPMSRREDNSNGTFVSVWPDSCAFVSVSNEWVDVEFVTMNEDLGKNVERDFRTLLKKRGEKKEVYVLVRDEDGYNLSSLGSHGLPLEKGNYEQSVVQSYEHVISDLREKSPCGRIVLVEGPPGTGKTHIIRGMIQESDNTTFILMSPTMVENITGPQIIQALVGWRRSSTGPIVFVLEDADAILSSRKFDNINAVNEVLNLGDGILGAALDIRIVATTNTGIDDIDVAILRDGRLCRRIEVGLLSDKTAKDVCTRLGIDWETVGEPRTLAEIYGSRKNGNKNISKKKKAGF